MRFSRLRRWVHNLYTCLAAWARGKTVQRPRRRLLVAERLPERVSVCLGWQDLFLGGGAALAGLYLAAPPGSFRVANLLDAAATPLVNLPEAPGAGPGGEVVPAGAMPAVALAAPGEWPADEPAPAAGVANPADFPETPGSRAEDGAGGTGAAIGEEAGGAANLAGGSGGSAGAAPAAAPPSAAATGDNAGGSTAQPGQGSAAAGASSAANASNSLAAYLAQQGAAA